MEEILIEKLKSCLHLMRNNDTTLREIKCIDEYQESDRLTQIAFNSITIEELNKFINQIDKQ